MPAGGLERHVACVPDVPNQKIRPGHGEHREVFAGLNETRRRDTVFCERDVSVFGFSRTNFAFLIAGEEIVAGLIIKI